MWQLTPFLVFQVFPRREGKEREVTSPVQSEHLWSLSSAQPLDAGVSQNCKGLGSCWSVSQLLILNYFTLCNEPAATVKYIPCICLPLHSNTDRVLCMRCVCIHPHTGLTCMGHPSSPTPASSMKHCLLLHANCWLCLKLSLSLHSCFVLFLSLWSQ